ncbi:MAG: DNA gyrase C-terminal beta-propeller domain-containing protein, partial [Chloroflexota bacterium]
SGMAIRFSEQDVRPMGLVAAGVMAMKLGQGERIIGLTLLPSKGELFFLASNGRAKRVKPDDFPTQGRHGKGVIAWKLPNGVQLVGCTAGKGTGRITLHLKKYAAKFVTLKDAPLQTRAAAKGLAVVEIRANDQITSVTVPWIVPRPLKKSK